MQSEQNAKILVLDDETRVCEVIKMLLSSRGIEVHTATSVQEAICLTDEISFDLFLIDKNIPGQDGFVFMDYGLIQYPEIPFIMMTGNASIDSAIIALKKGAYDYLRKPFQYEDLVNVVTNALSQKKLEDQNRVITAMLNDSERRYKDMIENSPDLIIMLDARGSIHFVNDTFTSTLGYHAKEIKGVPFMNIVDEKYVEMTHSFLDFSRSFQEEGASSAIDIEIKCSLGCASARKTLDVEIKKSNLSFNMNAHQGQNLAKEICIVGRDISLRKAFEEQMIYGQKMEAVGLLAGGVAHDFNNLLMGIQGYTSIIKSNLGVSHPCYTTLAAIEKNIAKGYTMNSKLLNFERGGTCKIKPENINHVIKDTLELFSINHKNIKVDLDLTAKLWKVDVDACQIEQVFLNMFINAGHAMGKKGKLSIRTENYTLNGAGAKKRDMRAGQYVKISIKDTGHGIDEEHQRKIFDPFFSTKERSEGSGLGLASAYGIIKKHNGVIAVSSKPGKGALFTIYIAVNSANVVEREILENADNTKSSHHLGSTVAKKCEPEDRTDIKKYRPIAAGSTNNKETVLVVEDDAVVQKVSVDILENMGFKTLIACDGREGVQKYMENLGRIDLVVLDMIMPGMKGSDAFQYIRKLNPHARILIASGYGDKDEISDLTSDDYCEFIKKPYSMDLFSDKVRSLLSVDRATV